MPPPLEPSLGAISFQHLAEIAAGATARVDLCRAVSGARQGQLLAVKRLHPHIAQDPAFANMFLDEAWMTAALKHKNVVEVAGWGTDAQGTYLAVELVQGVSLARLMKTVFDTGEVFSERMVVFIASELCAGLSAAHALRAPDGELLHLVHRDLSPGNVLVSFSGDVKIADFGLAKAKQRVTKTLTGLLKGKPQYMSPEQAKGQPIDGRADLFSLGVLLFELFAGRRPWSATSELQIMHVTANEPPLDLRECRPKIDKELVAIVTRCLEKDPAARFQSADEVGQRLVAWLSSHGYMEGNEEALARFVRRNAMRQMRWFERAVTGDPMPDSIRPPKAPPPRVPSYTGTSSPGDSRGARARVKPRKPPDSETTDVTDAESKVAALHAELAPPLIREAGPGGDIDWGEEVPTLVHKHGSEGAQELARARVRPRPAAGEPQGGHPPATRPRPPKLPVMTSKGGIVDEDSDQRATDVKKHGRHEDIPDPQDLVSTAKVARAVSIEVGAPSAKPSIADPESEELPTAPLGGTHQVHARHGSGSRPPPGALAGSSLPGSIMGSPLPGAVVPPGPEVPPVPVGIGGVGREPAAPRVGSPLVLPAPPPLDPPDAEGSRSPISGVHALAEARAAAPAATGAPRDTEEALLAEADRLAVEAVRLNEEAKAAAAQAVRKATMAKLAGDAAMIAAEAVRLAATGGIAIAARRLDEARALEAAIRRGEVSPASLPPGVAQGLGPVPGAAPLGVAPSSMMMGAAPQAVGGERQSFPPPRISVAPVSREEAARLSALDTGSIGLGTGPNAALDLGRAGALDDFRSRLHPTILGLPAAWAVLFGAVILVILILIVFAAVR